MKASQIFIKEIKGASSPITHFSALKSRDYSFLLDSAMEHKRRGRYSFFGCDPFLVFKSKGKSAILDYRNGKREVLRRVNPFTVIKSILERYRLPAHEGIPLISGGVGYFSYDLKGFVEELPDMADDDLGMADCLLGFYDVVYTYDHLKGKAYITSSGLPERDASRRAMRAKRRLAEFERILRRPPTRKARLSGPALPRMRSNFTKREYMGIVEKAKGYIRRGDIYQVNLSQRFEARLNEDPFDLYRRLRTVSPAPFSAYLNFDDVVILSSSPERFLLKRGDLVETRPIKGTRPRGDDAISDAALEDELIKSIKDNAEHVMIVDLERNDLGRISRYGSVKVDEFTTLERYSTVFHLVSTVTGKLKKGLGPVDCLEAAFPGGSITGAPKVRAMEIIEELEPVKRSVYTGAIGYLSFDGNMDTSIVIRTCIIKDGIIYFQVGGGIVADSDPEKEYAETLHKAQGFIQALRAGQREEELTCV